MQRSMFKPPMMPKASALPPSNDESHSSVSHESTSPDQTLEVTPWSQFFDRSIDCPISSTDSIRVYMTGSEGPLLFLIHGAGHSAMSWAMFAKRVSRMRVAALDLRGHGASRVLDERDLSAPTLIADILSTLAYLARESHIPHGTPLILCGHSLGGALAARSCASILKQQASFPLQMKLLVVVDMVEGTALAAMPHMMQLIEERTPSFPSLYDAYHSCLGKSPFTCRNPESLRVSLPSFLRKQEEDDRYYWRTDLKATEPHWQGWFQGLSDVFLGECRVPKLLVLAGTDRLDTPLTIGQMQGKFQMRVLPWVGHVVQEDAPDITAQAVQEFVDRYLR